MTTGALGIDLASTTHTDRSFADLYRAQLEGLMRFAYLLCGNQTQAEDAVAEVFAKVLPQWRQGRLSDPPAYLRRTLINEITSRGRRQVLQDREERRRSAAGRTVTHLADHVADRDVVLRALRQLPIGQRAVLVLRYYEDMAEAEVASTLGLAVGTVKSQASRGLARLRELMEAQ